MGYNGDLYFGRSDRQRIQISGASGVVGIRIDLKSERPEETADLTPIVAFTIPNRVGNDAISDEGVLVSAGNSSTLVAA